MPATVDDPVAGEMSVPGATIELSRTPAPIGPVPTPGQHAVLGRLLGSDGSRIDALRPAGATA
jgi:crotonobetainyl-CoA:carnitine CoA-transferase CaiB-like acyl-CoA transferase